MTEKIRNGVILAGGRSQRFGSDKALALYDGKTLVSRAVDLVRAVGLAACVITEKHKDYSFLDCPIYFDKASFQGPLAGLGRAFELFPDQVILVLTCDMPFLTDESIRLLLREYQEKASAVLYRLRPDCFQPFPGLYRSSLRRTLHLENGKKNSMQEFLKSVEGILEIGVNRSANDFSNINGPGDLSKAVYDASHSEPRKELLK